MLPHLGVLKVGDKVLARGLRYLFKIVYSLLQRKRKKKKEEIEPFSSRSGCILTKSNPNPRCSTLAIRLDFSFLSFLSND